MIYIIKNTHVTHVVIAAGDEILFSEAVEHKSAEKLRLESSAVDFSSALGKKFELLSYSTPYIVLAYDDTEKLATAKKAPAKKEPAKKAEAKKKK